MIGKCVGMIKEKLRGLTGWRWTGPAVFVLGFLAVFVLACQIAPYCDDYLYGTFLKHGWNYFWEQTVWHYNEFNGRVFIHFMCQLTLLFDTKLYMILCPIMLGYIFLMGQRLQGKNPPMWLAMLTAGVAMLAVAALPLNYIRTCVMWISSAFNYIFPPCVLLTALWLYTREPESKKAWAGILILCFLAGATTEQTGFAACICIGGWGLLGFLRGRLGLKKFLLPVLVAGVGYLTIIIAPGTWVRVDKDAGGGLSSLFLPGEFQERLRLSMQYLTGADGVPALFAAFLILFSLRLALKRKSWKAVLPGAGVLAAYLLLFATRHFLYMELLSMAALIAAGAWCLLKPETTLRGLLLFGLLGSQMIMLLNRSAAERTAMPSVLLLLTVCASLGAECFMELAALRPEPAKKRVWAAPAAAALCMLCLLPGYLPTLRGYMKNTPVVRANERELWDRSDDVIKIDLTLDPDYGYKAFYSSEQYLMLAMDYYGITNERMEFSQNGQELFGTQGLRAGLPFLLRGGELYAPIASTGRSCGGEAEWIDEESGIAVVIGDTGYLFRNNGQLFHWDAATQTLGAELPEGYDVWVPFDTHYAPAELLVRLFGLNLEFNEEQNTYYISPASK